MPHRRDGIRKCKKPDQRPGFREQRLEELEEQELLSRILAQGREK